MYDSPSDIYDTHFSRIFSNLGTQQKDGSFCDAVIHVDGTTLNAHKCLLASSSKYFETTLNRDVAVKEKLKLIFSGYSPSLATFEIFLSFVYQSAVNFDDTNVEDVLILASKLQCDGLVMLVFKYLANKVSSENILFYIRLCERYSLQSISPTLEKIWNENLLEILAGSEILDLSQLEFDKLLERLPLSDGSMGNALLACITRWFLAKLTKCETDVESEMLVNAAPVLLTNVPWYSLDKSMALNFLQTIASSLVNVNDYSSKLLQHIATAFNQYGLLPQEMLHLIDDGVSMSSDIFTDLAITAAIEQDFHLGLSREDILSFWQSTNTLNFVNDDQFCESNTQLPTKCILDGVPSHSKLDSTTFVSSKGHSNTELECELTDTIDATSKSINNDSNASESEHNEEKSCSKENNLVKTLKGDNDGREQFSDKQDKNFKRKEEPAQENCHGNFNSELNVSDSKEIDRDQFSVINVNSTQKRLLVDSTCDNNKAISSSPDEHFNDSDKFKKMELEKSEEINENKKKIQQLREKEHIQNTPPFGHIQSVDKIEICEEISNGGKLNNCVGTRTDKDEQTCENIEAKEDSDNTGSDVIEDKSSDVKWCDICSVTVKKSLYFTHMKQLHFTGPPHTCDYCAKQYHRIYHLLEHRLSHLGVTHSCPKCGCTFNKLYNLKVHLLAHEGRKLHKCEFCDLSFLRKQQLEEHKKIHDKELDSYCCTSCDFKSSSRSAMSVHSHQHKGDIYSCSQEGCSYSTSRKSHFTDHLLSHSNTKAFKCSVCSAPFKTKGLLARHRKTHDKNTKRCDYCDYTSYRSDIIKAHMARVHRGKL